jgi:hypothetical protein
VTSCDPIYRLDVAQIERRIEATYNEVLAETRRNADEFLWTSIASVADLGRVRMSAMNAFLQDFPLGKAEGRYIDAELPALPFADASFELALSSHFLFLYTTQLGEAFHRAAIREMCRVANEVRIFPLLALGGKPSPIVRGQSRFRRDRKTLTDRPIHCHRHVAPFWRLVKRRVEVSGRRRVGAAPTVGCNGRCSRRFIAATSVRVIHAVGIVPAGACQFQSAVDEPVVVRGIGRVRGADAFPARRHAAPGGYLDVPCAHVLRRQG